MDWLRVLPFIGPLWNWFRSRVGLNREHDVAIIKKLDAIANEARVDEILNDRIFRSNLRYDDVDVLRDLIETFNRIENRYLDGTVQLRAEELAWEMDRLLSLVHQTFWEVPSGKLKFHPDWIDPLVFDAEWKELNEKLECTWEAYKTYRMAVKDRLKL